MSRLVWGAAGTREFETGLDRGVLFPPNAAAGVAWNGLTSVKEAPSGGEVTSYYQDGVKYYQSSSAEEFVATIEAYDSPAEFAVCDGTANIYPGLFITNQPRKPFGLSYRTLVSNDIDADYGYNIHLVYNALAKPTQRQNDTITDSAEPLLLSWDLTSIPVSLMGYKPSAHLIINSSQTEPSVLAALENILYGTDSLPSRLPTATDLAAIFAPSNTLVIVDHGDGSYSATGVTVNSIDANSFTIESSQITDNGDGSFTIVY